MNPNTTKPIRFMAALAAIPLASLSAQSLQTDFTDPTEFRDLSVNGLNEERSLRIFKTELSENITRAVKRYLPEGTTLQITFTDVDMAGEIQPWRNIHNADIRYIERIYPPRLKFTYQLIRDDSSEVITEGEESISDLAFQMNPAASIRARHESFFYETELLADWIRKTFRDLKKPDNGS